MTGSLLRAQRFAPITLGVFVSTLALLVGCKKDEPPPPLPSATVATTAPPEPLRLAPEEDAGTPEPDAAVATGTKGGGGSSLKKCCDALLQNAQNAPEPNKSYMLTAGQACQAAVSAGTGNAGVLTIVQNALRGANLPSACK